MLFLEYEKKKLKCGRENLKEPVHSCKLVSNLLAKPKHILPSIFF